MGTDPTIALQVILGIEVLTLLYAWFLNAIHHLYAPDHIWATVVVGVAMLGGAFAFWLWRDPLSAAHPLEAFWRLVAVSVAGGGPIIAWQIGQANARHTSRKRNGNGSDDARGPRATERA